MRVRLLTYVFGRCVDLLKRSSASIAWPKNRKALEGALWMIYCPDCDEEKIREILAPIGIELEFHRIGVKTDVYLQFTDCLADALNICFKKNDALLLAPPDTIFGDGTIQTLVTLGSEAKTVISVPHARVVNFPELTEPISNAKLVGLAMKHLHGTWKLSSMAVRENNTYLSGVVWREIGPNLYAVTMRIPTPYFARPLEHDIERLVKYGPGAWDHKWPEKVVEEQRHRIIGSSDAAFMVELTEQSVAVGPTRANNPEPDAYRGSMFHHKVNRNSVVIWRAE